MASPSRSGASCGECVTPFGESAAPAGLVCFLVNLPFWQIRHASWQVRHTLTNLLLSLAANLQMSSCLRNLLRSFPNLLCSGSLCGEPVALSGKSAALADLSHFSVDLLHSGSLRDESVTLYAVSESFTARFAVVSNNGTAGTYPRILPVYDVAIPTTKWLQTSTHWVPLCSHWGGGVRVGSPSWVYKTQSNH